MKDLLGFQTREIPFITPTSLLCGEVTSRHMSPHTSKNRDSIFSTVSTVKLLNEDQSTQIFLTCLGISSVFMFLSAKVFG